MSYVHAIQQSLMSSLLCHKFMLYSSLVCRPSYVIRSCNTAVSYVIMCSRTTEVFCYLPLQHPRRLCSDCTKEKKRMIQPCYGTHVLCVLEHRGLSFPAARIRYDANQRKTIRYNLVQDSTMRCKTIQYNNAIQYNIVQNRTMQSPRRLTHTHSHAASGLLHTDAAVPAQHQPKRGCHISVMMTLFS